MTEGDQESLMYTKSGILELHATMHERLDLLLVHIAGVSRPETGNLKPKT